VLTTIALSDEFLEALDRLPSTPQRKVREFIRKFRTDPKSNAINYERLQGHKDPHVRTVRIDQSYRAVVMHPDEGNVYVLMWVDRHDEAMDWAKRRSFEVNPRTGALQIYCVQEITEALPIGCKGPKHQGLLDRQGDDVLLSFGVPEILLPAVRAIKSGGELVALGAHLPSEVAEALVWLSEGESPESVREAMSDRTKGPVNPLDLVAALHHPDSRRRFVTIQSDEELTAILDAPLEKWRVFLHPSQDRLVARSFNGPARVTGGAGTGKTVVAMHRARHLARTLGSSPHDKILFTTYTANLADDVRKNLGHLCGPEKDRIEVVNLHAWAARFLRDQGRKVEVASPSELDACWEEAIHTSGERGFDTGFLKQEWEQVVRANEIGTAAEYLKVPRIGRGRTLSRPQRQKVWKVFERYIEALLKRDKAEWGDIIRDARSVLELKTPLQPYKAVVVDEAQDFHAEEWRLLRAIAPMGPNDLFLVGDAHQRLYGQKIALRACGINVQGRSSRLRVNYRTTEEIRSWAMAMLEGVEIDDLDGGKEDETGYKSLLTGPRPDVRHFSTRGDELEYVGQRVKELVGQRPPEHVCLVARTNKLLKDDYEPMLTRLGIESNVLDQRQDGRGVLLATMHRVKGLEFPVMILAGVNAKYMPLPVPGVEDDSAAKVHHEDRERSLLFVAATRARDQLIVTYWGTPSPFLPTT
jgi:AAA domain/UvrD-like helicase C-terminal domain